MRHDLRDQTETQTRQNQGLEDIPTTISSMQINQEEFYLDVRRQDAELAKQRQILEQLGADLAIVSQYIAAHSVPNTRETDSRYVNGSSARKHPSGSCLPDIILRRGCTCTPDTAHNVENGENIQRYDCEVCDKSVMDVGPRPPQTLEKLRLLQKIGGELSEMSATNSLPSTNVSIFKIVG